VTSPIASDGLLVERRGALVWVTLDRPEALNALTRSMYGDLVRLCMELRDDRSAKALVIIGAGDRAFSAGADITQFTGMKTSREVVDYDDAGNAAFVALESVPIPTIAAIRGVCAGGGSLLAASCDVRIATPSARLGVPIARTLGNCLSTRDLARLVRAFGEARSRDLLLTARFMPAAELLVAGFLSEIVPDEAGLEARATELATHMAALSPLTVRATKESFLRLRREVSAEEDAELLATCFLSQDFTAAVAAFLGGRTPEWTGR
jgi:enoyl-CoA hydratase